ncbi:MAG: hypothetical protein KKG75_04570 [Nanoarchaeota archaeon]|nr:hypothetical protein [Nanoarchaeota archaeon]
MTEEKYSVFQVSRDGETDFVKVLCRSTLENKLRTIEGAVNISPGGVSEDRAEAIIFGRKTGEEAYGNNLPRNY